MKFLGSFNEEDCLIALNNNMKENKDFISAISHDLKTPIAIIKEGICLLLDRVPGDINEEQARILTTAKNNVDRLTRIIDELVAKYEV